MNAAIAEVAAPTAGRRRAVDAAVVIGLVAGVVAAFFPALLAEFVRWDDPIFVVDNPHVHGITVENLRWMMTAMHGGHFHPLTWLSWAIDYEIWGLNPFGYHLTNVLIHAINGVLLYFLLLRVFAIGLDESGRAAVQAPIFRACVGIGAALFAIHPLRVESVAWVTERRDVLSAMLLLCTVFAYLRSVGPGRTEVVSWRAYLATLLLLIASCLAKAWGMTFFAIAFVLDAYPLRRLPIEPWLWFTPRWLPTFGRLLLQKLPLIAVGVCSALLAGAASDEGMAIKPLSSWGIDDRILQAFYGLTFYTWKTVLPTDLACLYQLPFRPSPLEPKYLACFVFVAIVAAGLFMYRKRWPGLVAIAGVYFVSVLPVLGFLQSGEQFVADRYSYIACMGYSGLVGYALWSLWSWAARAGREQEASRRRIARLGFAGSGIAIFASGLLTFAQSTTWENSERLWTHAAQVAPSPQVYVNLGRQLMHIGKKEEALAAVRAAVELNPADGNAWIMYGNRMIDNDRFAEAEQAFLEAGKRLEHPHTALVNLGTLYLTKMQRPDQGFLALRAAVDYVERKGLQEGGPHVALGSALWRIGKYEEAGPLLRKALAFRATRESAQKELDEMAEAMRTGSPPAPKSP